MIISDLYPMLAAVFAGGLIGLEREWRGRAAGFRTHILVCLASALLMQAAMMQGDWAFEALPDENIVTDPTRMAHGVLTGVGFLCAGVIFRTGFSIHGLTTAASLWITSALGILFGAGLYPLGTVGTAVTVAILVALRLVSLKVPARQVIDAEAIWRPGDAAPLLAIEAALKDVDPNVRSIRFAREGPDLRRRWKLKVRGDSDLVSLSERLCAIDGLTEFSLTPRDD